MDKQAKKAKIAELKAQPQHIADEQSKPIQPGDGRKFTRQEVCKLLDCRDIEVVFMPGTGLIMLIDSEGKLKGRPGNSSATLLWETLMPGVSQYDFIAGPCVVCRTPMLR